MIVWSRLLRYLTHNQRVPHDQDARNRYGTWGWLTGRDMWKPDPTKQPCEVTAPGFFAAHTHTCTITWPHTWHECRCGATFRAIPK